MVIFLLIGNVIFASALDCWGFGVAKFANIWSKKLNLNKNILQKHLFEDYSYNPKTKKLIKCVDTNIPMFAMMILDPIWQLYDTAVTQVLIICVRTYSTYLFSQQLLISTFLCIVVIV
jgi:hypothetical protein